MFIFPAIDLLNGRCVRLRQGDYSRETVFSDDPAAVRARRSGVELAADRIHVVDLDGAKAGKPVNGPVIRKIVEAAGARASTTRRRHPHRRRPGSRLRLGRPLGRPRHPRSQLQSPEWVRTTATRFPDRIVLGVDAKNGFVATEGWLEVSKVRAVELAKRVSDSPLAAVVYTDIAKDGMMSGPNFDALAEMRDAVPLPVVASGGVCTLEHLRRLMAERIPGCIIGRALYEGAIDLAAALSLLRVESRKVVKS